MKLNKKYFLALLTALATQVVFGVELANAIPCEAELDTFYALDVGPGKDREFYIADDGVKKFDFSLNTYNGFAYGQMKDKEDLKINLYTVVETFAKDDYKSGGSSCVEYAKYQANKWEKEVPFQACIYRYMAQNNCDPSAFRYSGSGQKGNISSGASSNSSSSSAQSNSPESYNLQVSQTNKQNYQTIQRAYEQANAGRGKKHNKEANAIECMKNNPAQKSFKNNCNQPINFAYCFSGTVSGAKNETPQTLADLNCQGGQFGTLTIGAGENIPGSYQGLALEGLACKSPSQPVDLAFDRASNSATGRCSF